MINQQQKYDVVVHQEQVRALYQQSPILFIGFYLFLLSLPFSSGTVLTGPSYSPG